MQDFGLTGAAKHSEIGTYLDVRAVIIARSRFTGATRTVDSGNIREFTQMSKRNPEDARTAQRSYGGRL